MSGTRVVVETVCEHGNAECREVVEWPLNIATNANDFVSRLCEGGSRRTLTPGEYVLVEKVHNRWPVSALMALAGAEPEAIRTARWGGYLDALADTDHQTLGEWKEQIRHDIDRLPQPFQWMMRRRLKRLVESWDRRRDDVLRRYWADGDTETLASHEEPT